MRCDGGSDTSLLNRGCNRGCGLGAGEPFAASSWAIRDASSCRTARSRSRSPIMAQRSNMLRVCQPAISIITLSLVPASRHAFAAERRKSWIIRPAYLKRLRLPQATHLPSAMLFAPQSRQVNAPRPHDTHSSQVQRKSRTGPPFFRVNTYCSGCFPKVHASNGVRTRWVILTCCPLPFLVVPGSRRMVPRFRSTWRRRSPKSSPCRQP